MKRLKACLAILVCSFLAVWAFATPAAATDVLGKPTVTFKPAPTATDPRGVAFGVAWNNCTGIAKVEAIVTYKGKAVKKDEVKVDIKETNGAVKNWSIPLPDLKNGDEVIVEVFVYARDGTKIAATKSGKVPLK